MKRYLRWVAVVLVVAAVCCLESVIAAGSRDLAATRARGSGVYALAGEFRTVFANLLWIKADRYHHEFIEQHRDWTKNADLLGMMNLIVDLDPTFEEAYSTGAYMYLLGEKRTDRALEFIDQGLRNNPKSWELHRIAAISYARYRKNYPLARKHAVAALALCDDPFYKGTIRKMIRAIDQLAGHSGKVISPRP